MRYTYPCLLTLYCLLAPAIYGTQFPNPDPDYAFSFPKDHGNHPEFKIEWWYVVGHLYTNTDKAQRYGFQATFFRNRNHPADPTTTSDPTAAFGQEQIYMAHMALTNAKAKTYQHETRLNRNGWNAYSREDTLDIRNGNWTYKLEQNANGDEIFLLNTSINTTANIELRLTPSKPPIIFGEPGSNISIKGNEPDARSYYISYTRLAATGTLTINDEPIPVSGEAWMDHEISSNQIGAEIEGWDWLCIQFFQGRELKAYRLRTDEGDMSPHSRLIWIDQAGTLTYYQPSEYQWIEEAYWTSNSTGGRYPNRVTLQTIDPQTQQSVRYTLIPILETQEMTDTTSDIHYWEGACRVVDEQGDEVGSAYLELTGYAKKNIER